MGINNNSLASSKYISWNASLHSIDICNAHISYDSVTKKLSVSWDYILFSDPRERSRLSYIIDLAKVLPPKVMCCVALRICVMFMVFAPRVGSVVSS